MRLQRTLEGDDGERPLLRVVEVSSGLPSAVVGGTQRVVPWKNAPVMLLRVVAVSSA